MPREVLLGLALLALTASQTMAQTPEPAAQTDAAAALSALEAAEAAYQQAWEALPLTVRKGLFVEGPARAFGSYVPREDNIFTAGEKLHLYVEPAGFGYRSQGRLHGVSLNFDLSLYDEAGTELLFEQERFSAFEYQGRAKVRELYLNMEVEVTGIAPGGYVVAVTARDLVSGEAGEFRLPFRVAR